MRVSSVLFWTLFVISMLAYVTVFYLTAIFFFAYSDYSHIIEVALFKLEPVSTGDSLSTVITFGTLPILAVLALCVATFLIEAKTRAQEDHSTSFWVFGILGALTLFWGGFHLYAAIHAYVGATQMAAAAGGLDPNHAFLTIYGGYALGVGVLWIITAIALLIMNRKLRIAT